MIRGRRLLQALATLWGASVLVWALVPLAPGDPATRVLLARGVSEPKPAQISAVRRQLDLDRSLPARYVRWLGRAVRGDLSDSYRTGRPVTTELRSRLPATLLLAGAALLLALLIAVPAALTGAALAGHWPDRTLRLVTLLFAATPSFLVGLILLEVVVVDGGYGDVISSGDAGHVLLPAACLALGIAPAWTRLLRAGLVQALQAPHMTVAAARGASPRRLLLVHALPNAIVPFLTILGLSVGALIGGAAIVESVFTWPGVGRYTVDAINGRDLPVVQVFTLFAVLAYVTTSFVVDTIARRIDPRHDPSGAPA